MQLRPVTKDPSFSVLTTSQYTFLTGSGISSPLTGTNDNKSFFCETDFETPVILPFEVVAVMPPSAMTKFCEMTVGFVESVFATCIMYGALVRALRREGQRGYPDPRNGVVIRRHDKDQLVLGAEAFMRRVPSNKREGGLIRILAE
jgi:hypothetical protein